MEYLKIKSKKENIKLYGKDNIFTYFNLLDNFLIANELVTRKELDKMLKSSKYTIFNFECDELVKNKLYYTKDELIEALFDKVEIKKNNTYIAFGARFEK